MSNLTKVDSLPIVIPETPLISHLPAKSFVIASVAILIFSGMVSLAFAAILKYIPIRTSYCDTISGGIKIIFSYASQDTLIKVTLSIFGTFSTLSIANIVIYIIPDLKKRKGYIENKKLFSEEMLAKKITKATACALATIFIVGGVATMITMISFIIESWCNKDVNIKNPQLLEQFNKWMEQYHSKCMHDWTFILPRYPFSNGAASIDIPFSSIGPFSYYSRLLVPAFTFVGELILVLFFGIGIGLGVYSLKNYYKSAIKQVTDKWSYDQTVLLEQLTQKNKKNLSRGQIRTLVVKKIITKEEANTILKKYDKKVKNVTNAIRQVLSPSLSNLVVEYLDESDIKNL